jgi:hypothetical protein
MMRPAVRNRLIIAVVVLIVGGFIALQMFHSLTPPRHADHDHAMATIDAGGFLWIRALDGDRRNLVGPPGKVLVLHWFDASDTGAAEQRAAARLASSGVPGTDVDVLLIAVGADRDAVRSWAEANGIAPELVYLDVDGATTELIGVRRLPETLIYDPRGRLAYQARGPMRWNDPALPGRIADYARGVDEID